MFGLEKGLFFGSCFIMAAYRDRGPKHKTLCLRKELEMVEFQSLHKDVLVKCGLCGSEALSQK